MENPYSLVFGKMPENFIERDNVVSEIVETFREKEPSIRTYILTGVRGSGKTVCLSKIEKILKEEKDFCVISLNSDLSLLESAYEELEYSVNKGKLLRNVDVGIAAFGAEIKKKERLESYNLLLQNLLEKLTNQGKRILFCIDEVSNTSNIKSFCQAFNIWLRKDYNVLFLMTGLKKNVLSLQGDDRVSFLKRAEKIEVAELSLGEIRNNYQSVFGISDEEASRMASFTKGYSYAFQALGYLCFKQGKKYEDIIDDFDIKMADNVYDIIWADLTEKEKEVVKAVSKSDYSTMSILQCGNFSKEIYNEYRRILIVKGILLDEGYGKIAFRLPRFAEIVNAQTKSGFWT